VTTLSAQQCGHAGAQCQPCAACDRCSGAGACELDPESKWDFAALSAVVSPIDPNSASTMGSDWDVPHEPVGGPLPDPFCELYMPVLTLIGQLPSIPDTLTPGWSALTAPAAPLLHAAAAPLRAGDLVAGGKAWRVSIGDDDSGSIFPSGETICTINGPLQASDFHAGGFTRHRRGQLPVGDLHSDLPALTLRH